MASWEASFAPDTWERYVDRLGNLIWLEPALNRRVGNAEADAKLEAYRESRYAISRSIADHVAHTWSPAQLEARQARMARRAVPLWRADFA